MSNYKKVNHNVSQLIIVSLLFVGREFQWLHLLQRSRPFDLFFSLADISRPPGAHLLKVCCRQEIFKLLLIQRTQTKDQSTTRESVV